MTTNFVAKQKYLLGEKIFMVGILASCVFSLDATWLNFSQKHFYGYNKQLQNAAEAAPDFQP